MLEEALSEKTKVVMIAHTQGNSFDLKAVSEFCKEHRLWLVEDNRMGLTETGWYGIWKQKEFGPECFLQAI